MKPAEYCKNLISKELCDLITLALLRRYDTLGPRGDQMIPGAMAILNHDMFLDTVLEQLWPDIEEVVGEELFPTYSYARLYNNGDILEKHKDRGACEISVTIQLSKSHNYSWPIFMEKEQYIINTGDGVVYQGCEIEHWREECAGPKGYYSAQAFFHFVKKNGDNSHLAGDPYQRTVNNNMFIKNRMKSIYDLRN